jgi:hypothetical protein
VEIERLSQVVRRDIDFVGVCGAGGVTGLEHNAIVLFREGGARVRPVTRRPAGLKPAVGATGSALLNLIGAENADPMSESVSDRTCIRIEGAM